MSSFTGTGVTEQDSATLQLAPKDDELPDFGELKGAFDLCLANNQTYQQQTFLNFQTRYALWDGQSYDGRKHAREGAKVDPTPWDGASDLRVYLVDEAINSKVAMLCTAFRKANIVAIPVEGNDIKRAKVVSLFMRWMIQTQIPDLDREVELLSNYIQEKGVGVMGQFWEVVEEKTLATVSLKDFQAQYPQMNIGELIYASEAEDAILGLFEEIYGASRKKAKKMLNDLRNKGTTTVAVVGKTKSRPVIRAFNLDNDLFIDDFATDLQTAPAIYRVQYFTPEQLRGFANTDGWDREWVEAAIEHCRGKLVTQAINQQNFPIQRSLLQQDTRLLNLIGVVYAYRRLSDEDGVPGVYLTIFNPFLGPDPHQHDGFAKHGLLGYAHGQYPFVLFRREYLSRQLHDSRGLPEPGQPWQQQIKVHRDSRIDAASMAILPPMCYPMGRPPGRWGPGARIPERRAGEYHFADRPAPDGNTEQSEEILVNSFYRYCGFVSAETDPTFANLKNQQETEKFLKCFQQVFKQVWSLWKQNGPAEVYFRVSGLKQTDPVAFEKGADDEEFNYMLDFSLDSLDPEKTLAKLEQVAKIVATADREGVVNYVEWLTAMIESVDPVLAERIIEPREIGAARVVSQMQETLTKVFAGQDQDIQQGTPPELGLNVIQNYVSGDPVVQRRLQDQADPFGKRIEKLMKQLQFQMQQRQNAVIGRLGA